MSEPVSRRNFIKGVTAVVGGLISTMVGIPTIAYQSSPLDAGAASGRGRRGGHFQKCGRLPAAKPIIRKYMNVKEFCPYCGARLTEKVFEERRRPVLPAL